jgi:Na/Pi-cotransporter
MRRIIDKIKSCIFCVAISVLCSTGLLLVTGCGQDVRKAEVRKLSVIRGAGQCALPGEMFQKKLIVSVLGSHSPGLLGGKGDRVPVVGEKVLFVPVDGSKLKLSATEAVSNGGGEVVVSVTAGKSVGDQYLKVIPVSAPDRSITVRFVSGVKILGANQETYAGDLLENSIRIMAVGDDGKPLKDVPVYFSLANTPEKKGKSSARITSDRVLTDEEGVASTNIKVGSKTGVYTIEAEIADKKRSVFIRGIKIKAMAVNLFELIITVLGGLALFVLGMTMMSDGLQIIAGDKMKRFLQFFASNRFIAILAGTVVTAVIQSSSACSVMVIGFVNAGLLKLFQAIGIVLGADIGTTVTAQIISFKLGALALPAVVIGTIMMLVVKNKAAKGWGTTVLGFGLLFFGMGMMGGELKAIGKFPTFIHFFSSFDCNPVNGYMPVSHVIGAFFIGALLTVVIQSSSASIGIIMALAGSGLINFYTAMPLMLGANVGTTITAVIACIPTNRRAKQVALSHVLTKTIGTVYMMALFYVLWPGSDQPIFMYVVNKITTGNVFAAIPQNVMRHVANAHTLFNVVNVALFIPLIGVIDKICNIIIPIKEDKLKFTHLEPHLLDTPSIALDQVIHSIRYMVKESWSMVESSMKDSFLKGSVIDKDVEALERREQKIDQLQNDITEYLVQLTRRELTGPQAEIVPLLMHCTNDAEKIADHTENIIELTLRLKKAKKDISKTAEEEIGELWKLLSDQAANVLMALNNQSPDGAAFALKDEKKINKLVDKYEKDHVKRLNRGECDPLVGIVFIEMLAELEKVGDHLSNIAERAPEIQKHYFNLG